MKVMRPFRIIRLGVFFNFLFKFIFVFCNNRYWITHVKKGADLPIRPNLR